jgi:hypothetical protein
MATEKQIRTQEITRQKMKKISEYEKFDQTTRGLLSVSHDEIKSKLAAEKSAKKPKKSKVSSASREAGEKA